MYHLQGEIIIVFNETVQLFYCMGIIVIIETIYCQIDKLNNIFIELLLYTPFIIVIKYC